MTNHIVEEEYTIKMIKPSKYKKIKGWAETSAELSKKEIEKIILLDMIDNVEEKSEKYLHMKPENIYS